MKIDRLLKIMFLIAICLFIFSCAEDESIEQFYATTKFEIKTPSPETKVLSIDFKKVKLVSLYEQDTKRKVFDAKVNPDWSITAIYGTYKIVMTTDIEYVNSAGEHKSRQDIVLNIEYAYICNNAPPIELVYNIY